MTVDGGPLSDQERQDALSDGAECGSQHSLYVWLQAGLLLVVVYEEGQAFRPVVLEAARQVHVHTVLCEGRVQVCVEVPGVLCGDKGGTCTCSCQPHTHPARRWLVSGSTGELSFNRPRHDTDRAT